MICPYFELGHKCIGCSSSFSAHWVFLFEVSQALNLLFIFLLIIFANKDKSESDGVRKAASLSIVSFVFAIINKISTILISIFRGDLSSDIETIEQLLCCYKYCPNCGCFTEYLLSFFGCNCVTEWFTCACLDNINALIVEVAIQFISGIVTFALEVQASNSYNDSKSEKGTHDILAMLVMVFAIIFLGIFIFVSFLNIICIIHHFVIKCKRQESEKEEQVSEQPSQNDIKEEENKDDHVLKPNQNDDEQHSIENQNVESVVALQDNNTIQINDTENPDNDDQKGEHD